MSTISVSSPVSAALFLLPALVRAQVPSNTRASGQGIRLPLWHESLHIPTVTHTILQLWRPRLLTCLWWTMRLTSCTFSVVGTPPAPFLPPQPAWRHVLLVSGDPCSVPCYKTAWLYSVVNCCSLLWRQPQNPGPRRRKICWVCLPQPAEPQGY